MTSSGIAIPGGPWRYMKCRNCGYEMVWDTCGCILPLCNPPSRQHDWEKLEESYDRLVAFNWRLNLCRG